MSDQITTPVNGETPEASPATPKTPEVTIGEHEDVSETPSTPTPTVPDEVQETWEHLSGKTQDRVRELIRERNEALEKANKTLPANPPYEEPKLGAPASNDEVKQAVKVLKDYGVATMEDVNAILARIQTNQTHDGLERKYSGTDGLPKYVREEVEDYARRNQIWSLEAAYRDMYFDEMMDQARNSTKRKVLSTEKPTGGAPERKEPMTVESFRSKLRNPDGSLNMIEYEKLAKDPNKLDALLKELAS